MKSLRLKTGAAILLITLCALLYSCYGSSGNSEVSGTGQQGLTPDEPYSESTGERIVAPPVSETAPDFESAPPETAEPEEQPVRLSFVAAGDNVIHPNIYMDAERRALEGGRKYNFKPVYEEVAGLISEADIAFINQETLMAGESYGYSGYPTFNSPQDLAYDLCELGFDIVNIANNHMADKGTKGLADTIAFWKSMPVMMIGGYDDAADFDNIRVYSEQGVSIAMLSYTYGTNGISISSSSPIKIPYLNDDDITRQVQAARGQADLVFVSVHWGEENMFKPTDEQRRLAALMASLGVDVIIGHHPHVLQPVEWIERGDGGRTLCIYSLGNLISTMMQGRNMTGGFMTFDIVKDSEGARIENPLFLPTIYYYGTNYYSTRLYFMENFTEELAASHGTQRYGYLDTLPQLISYATNNIAAEFLPQYILDLAQ